MKTIRVLIVTAANLLTCQAGAQFAVDWFTLDSGGSTSQGGRFSLRATIGQAVAAPTMGGGAFSVEGAFASLFPIPIEQPPLLSIRLGAANTVVFSWPFSSSGFVLQETTDLDQPNWVATPAAVPDNGASTRTIPIPPVGSRYYRLFKP